MSVAAFFHLIRGGPGEDSASRSALKPLTFLDDNLARIHVQQAFDPETREVARDQLAHRAELVG